MDWSGDPSNCTATKCDLVEFSRCVSPEPQLSSSILRGAFLLAIALILTVTNTLAFSRCDKFSHASTFASGALSGGIAGNLASGMFGRLFR